MSLSKSNFPITSSCEQHKYNNGVYGNLNGRSVVPVSHGSGLSCFGTFTSAILLTGILLWALGTTPSMVVAGQVLFGLSLSSIVILGCVKGCKKGLQGV